DADGGVDAPAGEAGSDATGDATGTETAPPDAGGDGRCSGSSLSGTVMVPTSPVDLTTEGTVDWRHWGLDGMTDSKTGAGNRISDFTLIGNGTTSSPQRGLLFNWADGSGSRMSVTGAPYAYAVAGTGDGFEVTVTAEATTRTLAFYVSGDNDTGLFTASLLDGCVPDSSLATTNTPGYS